MTFRKTTPRDFYDTLKASDQKSAFCFVKTAWYMWYGKTRIVVGKRTDGWVATDGRMAIWGGTRSMAAEGLVSNHAFKGDS